jgi:hypothetical protein
MSATNSSVCIFICYAACIHLQRVVITRLFISRKSLRGTTIEYNTQPVIALQTQLSENLFKADQRVLLCVVPTGS